MSEIVVRQATLANHAAQAVYQAAGWRRDEQFFVYHFTF
jgi:hypothetical protein